MSVFPSWQTHSRLQPRQHKLILTPVKLLTNRHRDCFKNHPSTLILFHFYPIFSFTQNSVYSIFPLAQLFSFIIKSKIEQLPSHSIELEFINHNDYHIKLKLYMSYSCPPMVESWFFLKRFPELVLICPRPLSITNKIPNIQTKNN